MPTKFQLMRQTHAQRHISQQAADRDVSKVLPRKLNHVSPTSAATHTGPTGAYDRPVMREDGVSALGPAMSTSDVPTTQSPEINYAVKKKKIKDILRRAKPK